MTINMNIHAPECLPCLIKPVCRNSQTMEVSLHKSKRGPGKKY